MVYFYNEHRYESAKDAINFARLEAERAQGYDTLLDKLLAGFIAIRQPYGRLNSLWLR